MNRQEAFNTVAEHLLTQNSRAVDVDGNCVYRAPNGKIRTFAINANLDQSILERF